MPDPLNLSPQDRDYFIRTIIGETGATDPSSVGVAQVIANRMRATGQSAQNVVLAPGQFDAWADRPNELMSYAPTDPAYRTAAQIVDNVASGKTPDATSGATQYYAPAAQAKLHQMNPTKYPYPPPFDNGKGQTIGAHKFFGGGNQPDPDPFSEYPTAQPTAASPAPAQGKVSTGLSEFPAALKGAPAPATKSTPAAAGEVDPFSEYPTAAAPTSGTTIPPPAITSPPPTSVMSDPGLGVEFLNSFPIVGPSLVRAGAAVDALTSNAPGSTFSERYGSALSNAENLRQNFASAHPVASAATDVAGGVAGTLPAIFAAPTVFGAGEGGLLARSALSGLSGGGINAADTAARGGDVDEIGRSAVLGGTLGLVAPGAANLVGRGISAIGDRFGGIDPGARALANYMHRSNISPLMAGSDAAAMGPYGTLLDTSHALSDLGGAVAAQGEEPTEILKQAMAQRGAGASGRIAQAVDANLGARPDLTATQGAIADQASQNAKPFYDAARTAPTPMDATPVVSYIDGQLQSAKGGVASTLKMARGLLTKPSALPGVTVPESDPQALLGARQALDDYIQRAGDADTTAGKNALRQAGAVRSQIDALLKVDPNIAQGDAVYAAGMRKLDALNEGTELFKPGTRIEDVSRSIASKTPDQIDAMRMGALSALHDALANARNGEYSAARSLLAKATANRSKLDALFPGARDVFDNLANEISFRETEHNVAQNSRTASRLNIGEMLKPKPSQGNSSLGPTLLADIVGGPGSALAVNAASHVKNSIAEALAARANLRMRTGLASALSASGANLPPVVEQLNRAFNPSAAGRTASALTNATVRNISPAVPHSAFFPHGVPVSALLSTLAGQQ